MSTFIASNESQKEAHAVALLALAEAQGLPAGVIEAIYTGFWVPESIGEAFDAAKAEADQAVIDDEILAVNSQLRQLLPADEPTVADDGVPPSPLPEVEARKPNTDLIESPTPAPAEPVVQAPVVAPVEAPAKAAPTKAK